MISDKKVKTLEIPRFQDTRWNSLYFCMRRIWILKSALLQYAIKDGCVLPGEWTASRFDVVADLVDCLGPIAGFSTAI